MMKNDPRDDNKQQPCLILCTVNDHNNAVKIAQQLLDKRLAACVSLLPELTSLYLWENNITQDKEVLLLIKSTNMHQADLFDAIKQIHPYKVPELIRLDIDQIEGDYLKWLLASIK